MNNFLIRPFQTSDTPSLLQLFKDAVNTINIKDYSEEQIMIWSNSFDWQNQLEKNITFIAEINNIIIGFADMTQDGHLCHFYIHKDYLAAKGYWAALKLFKAIELKAQILELTEITTYCSITAKKPAERMGFVVIYANTAIKNNVKFINYFMKKSLK